MNVEINPFQSIFAANKRRKNHKKLLHLWYYALGFKDLFQQMNVGIKLLEQLCTDDEPRLPERLHFCGKTSAKTPLENFRKLRHTFESFFILFNLTDCFPRTLNCIGPKGLNCSTTCLLEKQFFSKTFFLPFDGRIFFWYRKKLDMANYRLG